VKLPAEEADMRATQFERFFTQNTPRNPRIHSYLHVSVRTFSFMSPPPPSVHFFRCSDATEIVRKLEAEKSLEDGTIIKKRLKKLIK
jgi:hypothetical protein